jgi:hypothetical protein
MATLLIGGIIAAVALATGKGVRTARRRKKKGEDPLVDANDEIPTVRTGREAATSNILLSGRLLLKGRWSHHYYERFVVLTPKQLVFFRRKADDELLGNQVGAFMLESGVRIINVNSSSTTKRRPKVDSAYVFKVALGGKVVKVRAPTVGDCERWKKGIASVQELMAKGESVTRLRFVDDDAVIASGSPAFGSPVRDSRAPPSSLTSSSSSSSSSTQVIKTLAVTESDEAREAADAGKQSPSYWATAGIQRLPAIKCEVAHVFDDDEDVVGGGGGNDDDGGDVETQVSSTDVQWGQPVSLHSLDFDDVDSGVDTADAVIVATLATGHSVRVPYNLLLRQSPDSLHTLVQVARPAGQSQPVS